MGDPVEKTNTIRTRSITRQSVVLALILAVPLPLIAWVQYRSFGSDGLMATFVGAAVCLVAGLLALAVTGLGQEMGEGFGGLSGLLGSILIRTGIPLGAGLAFQSRGGPLANAGVFGVIMVYYLIMLTAETILAVQAIRPTDPVQKATTPGTDR